MLVKKMPPGMSERITIIYSSGVRVVIKGAFFSRLAHFRKKRKTLLPPQKVHANLLKRSRRSEHLESDHTVVGKSIDSSGLLSVFSIRKFPR